ncbi:MAG: hypothetical protein ACNI3A_01890 [Desulfovibrio sp.]|uniref:hypothetical protein n=1 Tax=Desulfovibrio sp. 7SRBS1 TaxID=3378064 RepID=UPI003B3EBA00
MNLTYFTFYIVLAMVLFMFLYAKYSQYDTDIRNSLADLEEVEAKVTLYVETMEQEIKEKREKIHDLEHETTTLRDQMHNKDS